MVSRGVFFEPVSSTTNFAAYWGKLSCLVPFSVQKIATDANLDSWTKEHPEAEHNSKYITSHVHYPNTCTTLHYITLHYITLHYITLHTYIHAIHTHAFLVTHTQRVTQAMTKATNQPRTAAASPHTPRSREEGDRTRGPKCASQTLVPSPSTEASHLYFDGRTDKKKILSVIKQRKPTQRGTKDLQWLASRPEGEHWSPIPNHRWHPKHLKMWRPNPQKQGLTTRHSPSSHMCHINKNSWELSQANLQTTVQCAQTNQQIPADDAAHNQRGDWRQFTVGTTWRDLEHDRPRSLPHPFTLFLFHSVLFSLGVLSPSVGGGVLL